MLGTVIGNYRVEEEIGRGGMGVVYRATHLNMDRVVAIKALLPQFAADDEVRRRLFQEQRILDRLRHANIVALHDVYVESGAVYLVMEYIAGDTLDQVVLNDGPMPFNRVAAMGQQLLSALALAHSRGVVHRDIKPPNIILTRSEAKLLDFGIAKAADAARLTSPDLIVGSPAYLPPELWKGEDASPRSDIYALGLCLYEGLMGRPALQSNSGWQAFFSLHTQTDIPHLGGRLPESWTWLADAIHTATRRDPAVRYADAKAMLRVFRRNLGVSSEMSLGGPGDPTWGDDATEMLVPGERMRLRDEDLAPARERPLRQLGPGPSSAPTPVESPAGTQFVPVTPSHKVTPPPTRPPPPAPPTLPPAEPPPAAPVVTLPAAAPVVAPPAPPSQPPTQPPDLVRPPSPAPQAQRPYGLLAAVAAVLIALIVLVAVLMAPDEPAPTLARFTLQVTNPLDEVVAVTCASGPQGQETRSGVELGPKGRGEISLEGLPASCEGTTVSSSALVLTWELPKLRQGITTYAVNVGDPPGQETDAEPPAPEEPAQASTRRPSKASTPTQAKAQEQPRQAAVSARTTSSGGCSSLSSYDAKAIVGELTGSDKTCLELKLSNATRQTDKIDISNVLLVDADARNDTNEFMRLAERHLKEYSQADPVICFKYAVKLRSKGRHSEAIKWAERALENRDKFDSRYASRWTGDLLKVRAYAANSLWESADSRYLATRNPMDKIKADNTRNQAKTYAKAWLDFARSAGRDEAKALNLCTSTAGTVSYCQ